MSETLFSVEITCSVAKHGAQSNTYTGKTFCNVETFAYPQTIKQCHSGGKWNEMPKNQMLRLSWF